MLHPSSERWIPTVLMLPTFLAHNMNVSHFSVTTTFQVLEVDLSSWSFHGWTFGICWQIFFGSFSTTLFKKILSIFNIITLYRFWPLGIYNEYIFSQILNSLDYHPWNTITAEYSSIIFPPPISVTEFMFLLYISLEWHLGKGQEDLNA